jgi:putative membrane protein
MLLFHQGGRVFDHDGWWFFGLVPFLFLLALIALAVWAVMRVTGRASAGVSVPAVRVDPALEEVRLRYARGEVDREEYLQRARDLGGTVRDLEGPTPGSPGA